MTPEHIKDIYRYMLVGDSGNLGRFSHIDYVLFADKYFSDNLKEVVRQRKRIGGRKEIDPLVKHLYFLLLEGETYSRIHPYDQNQYTYHRNFFTNSFQEDMLFFGINYFRGELRSRFEEDLCSGTGKQFATSIFGFLSDQTIKNDPILSKIFKERIPKKKHKKGVFRRI